MGLRFDRIESGYVDAFTGDPALRRIVENEPAPQPADLACRADELLCQIPQRLDGDRSVRSTLRFPTRHAAASETADSAEFLGT